MAEPQKSDAKKPSGLKKKFAAAVGGMALGVTLVVGGSAAVNGVDKTYAEIPLAEGGVATLKTTTISPVFERQVYTTPTANYWCVSAASIPCPIPIPEKHKPAYDLLKKQIDAPKP